MGARHENEPSFGLQTCFGFGKAQKLFGTQADPDPLGA
jgi:hypothetical protein